MEELNADPDGTRLKAGTIGEWDCEEKKKTSACDEE